MFYDDIPDELLFHTFTALKSLWGLIIFMIRNPNNRAADEMKSLGMFAQLLLLKYKIKIVRYFVCINNIPIIRIHNIAR